MDEATVKINKEEWRKNLHRDADFKKFFSMKTVVDTLQVRLLPNCAMHVAVMVCCRMTSRLVASAIL